MSLPKTLEIRLHRFGNDHSVAVEELQRGRPSIVPGNRSMGLAWNILDAEVYAYARLRCLDISPAGDHVRHWMGAAHWRERCEVYEEVVDRLGIPATDDYWEFGTMIYADFQRRAGIPVEERA